MQIPLKKKKKLESNQLHNESAKFMQQMVNTNSINRVNGPRDNSVY